MAQVEQMFIFMVTVLKHKMNGEFPGRIRCWGWKRSLEDAEQAVIMNATDMFELNYYDMAVIEKVPEGIASFAKERWWYKADYQNMRTQYDPKVEKIPEPKEYKQISNWWG